MYYSQDIIETVRTGNDIVEVIGGYTRLKQSGNAFMGLCPFHKESTPSFSVSPDKQLYHCFGCGASGNVISFIMKKENYDFVDCIKYLAARINYTLPEQDYTGESKRNNELRALIYEMNKKAGRYFFDKLCSQEGQKAREYLDKRGIETRIRRKYGLGYADGRQSDLYAFLKKEGYDDEVIDISGLIKKTDYRRDKFINRLMFPIIDVQGRVIAFGGRSLEDNKEKHIPKYLNSPETLVFNKSSNLYSLNFARLENTKEFILVEGYMDVISLYQAGFRNAVAALGTAFNDSHARALKRYAKSVILLFDSDEAGTKAAHRAIPILSSNGISSRVLQVTGAKDPDEYIKKYGAGSFSKLLEKAQDRVVFQIMSAFSKYSMSDPKQKIDFINEAVAIISKLDGNVQKEVYIKETSKISGISEEAIISEVKRHSEVEEYNPQRYIKKNTKGSGLEEAKKSVIGIISENTAACKAIKDKLSPDEFADEPYVSLAREIYKCCESGKAIYPAELVSIFDDIDMQQKVSSIFTGEYVRYDNEKLSELLTDYYRLIKRTYIESLYDKYMAKQNKDEQDLKQITRLIKEKKSVSDEAVNLS